MIRRLLLSAGTSLLAVCAPLFAAEPADPLQPSGDGLNAPEGFKTTLIASDPMVNNPAAMCVAPDGRIFVGVDFVHAHVKGKDRDNIKVLLGTENGGKATSAVTLLENLGSVQGMTFHDGYLYFAQTPFISRISVSADNKAGPIENLFTGVGIKSAYKAAHCASGLTVHDGKLYIVFGDQGCDLNTKEGKHIAIDSGAILRCDLDGSNLEVYAHGFRNIYGVSFDALGNAFVRDNTNDGGGYNVRSYHVIKGGYYGWPFRWRQNDATPQVDVLPMTRDNGGGSPTGAMFLASATYPAPYRGSALFCEWGRGMILRAVPTAKDATYDIPEIPFLSGVKGDKEYTFRPTTLELAPDQSLVVADWASGGLYPTTGKGRIYRVTYTGPKAEPAVPTAAEQLTLKTDTATLIEKLKDADAAVRAHAAFLLGEKVEKSSIPQLTALLADSYSLVRLRAATALGDMRDPSTTPALAKALVTEKDRWVRYCLVRGVRMNDDLAGLQTALETLPEPAQSDLLFALPENFDPKVAAYLLTLSGKAAPSVRKTATAFLGLIAKKETARWVWGDRPYPQPAERTVEWESTKEIVAQLHKLIRDPELAVRAEAANALATLKDDTVVDLLLADLKSGAATLDDAMITVLLKSVGNERALPQFVQYFTDAKQNPETRLEVLRALLAMNKPESLAALRQVAFDPQSNSTLSSESIEGLGKLKDAESAPKLREILASGQPFAQRAAARALGLIKDTAALQALETAATSSDRSLRPQALIALWRVDPTPHQDTFLKRLMELPASDDVLESEVISGLMGGPAARAEPPLILWLESGKLAKSSETEILEVLGKWNHLDVNPPFNAEKRAKIQASVKKLRAEKLSDWKQPEVTKAPAQIAVDPNETEESRLTKLTQAALTAKGDPANGAKVFSNLRGANCVACHTVNGTGGHVGPELSEVGSKYQRPFLIESVLYPSKQLLDGYELTMMKLKSGERLSGIVQKEDGTTLRLAKSDGSVEIVQIENIEKRVKSKNSLMPDGLYKTMTQQEFFDLISYLETLLKK